MSRCNISQVLWLQFLQAHPKPQKQFARSSCVEGRLMPPMGVNPRHNHRLPTYPTAAACTPPRVSRGGRKGQGSSKGHNSLHRLFPDLVKLWRAEGGEEEGIFILQHTKEVMKVWQCQSLAACHGIIGVASPFLLKPGCLLCWGKQEPPRPDPPTPSHCRLAQDRGFGGGRCDGECLCGSLLIC